MSAFDGDRNGILNPLEQADQNEFRFNDVNRDGALNFQEFARADNAAEFGRYDTNRDGLVDAPEFERGETLIEHRFGF